MGLSHKRYPGHKELGKPLQSPVDFFKDYTRRLGRFIVAFLSKSVKLLWEQVFLGLPFKV